MISKTQYSDSVHRTTLEKPFIQAAYADPICACYVHHTLLHLRNKMNKTKQAAVFNLCVLVKISRILEK